MPHSCSPLWPEWMPAIRRRWPGLPAWPRVDPADTTPYVQGLDLHRIGSFDRAAKHDLAFWDALARR